MNSRRYLILLCVVFLALLGVEVYGFRTGHLFSQNIWDPIGLHRLVRLAGTFLAAALPVLLIAPWAFAALVCGLVIVLTTLAVGPLPVLATTLFLVSSRALGSLILGRTEAGSATLLGMAVYIFLMNLVARLPLNYPAVWLILLAIPVLLDWRGVVPRFAFPELRSWGGRASFALLTFGLMMHWLVALKPEQSADGLAMHLAIPANIAVHHAFTFEPTLVVWSEMPMGADFAYSIVYLLGGEFAARLLNFAMLLIAVALLYGAVRRFLEPAPAFLLLASFATTPLVQLVTGSLFIENTLAAMILGVMTALWRFSETGERKFLFLAMALGGTALSIKLAALSFLIVALPFVFAQARRHWKSCVLAGGLLLLAGLPPYARAWWKTRNPIFPFKNEKIHSPLLDPSVQFQDNQFRRPLTWHTPFDLTFRSQLFYESQDGAFGFQYLLLAPLGLLALPLVRRRVAVSAGVVALGTCILVLRAEPNARYLYAALPLMFVPLAALIEWLGSNGRWFGHVLAGCVAACALLNIYFIPASGWYHKNFYLSSPFSRASRESYIREFVPLRHVIEHFNQAHPGSPVLLTTDNDTADVKGPVYADHWHYYTVIDQLRRAAGPPDMLRLFDRWGVRYFIGRMPGNGDPTDPPELEKFVEACTVPEYQSGVFRLWRLDTACGSGRVPKPRR